MTQDEIKAEIANIDRQLDPLENWRLGYDQGIKFSLELINEMTNNNFKSLAEIIIRLRND